ncbi:MAG: hypothetical protein SGJ00_08600 [bacterium]|nr:hypothetical protein [bacterium]
MRKLLLAFVWLGLNLCAFSQNLASFTQHDPIKFPSNPSVQTTGMGNKLVSRMAFKPNHTSLIIAACSDCIYK